MPKIEDLEFFQVLNSFNSEVDLLVNRGVGMNDNLMKGTGIHHYVRLNLTK